MVLGENVLDIDEIVKERSKGRPIANFSIDELKDIFTEVEFDKAFFHEVGGKAWQWFLPIKGGGAIALPVYPKCPVQLMTQDAFESDIKEFKQELDKKKELTMRDCNDLENTMNKLLKENS